MAMLQLSIATLGREEGGKENRYMQNLGVVRNNGEDAVQ
jgi:hypothetical protein